MSAVDRDSKKWAFLVTVRSAGLYAADLMRRWLKAVVGGAIGCLVCMGTAQAHVAWVTERDSVFEPGQQVTVTWKVTIPHDTVAFEVEFYLEPEAEPVSVASVAPDVLSYDWLIPDVVCDTCSLRVIQDNTDVDYEATLPIRIGVEPDETTGAGGTGAIDGTATMTGSSATVSGAGGNSVGSGTTSATVTATVTTATLTASAATSGPSDGTTTGESSVAASEDDSNDSGGSCSLANALGAGESGNTNALWVSLSLLGIAVSRHRRARPESN